MPSKAERRGRRLKFCPRGTAHCRGRRARDGRKCHGYAGRQAPDDVRSGSSRCHGILFAWEDPETETDGGRSEQVHGTVGLGDLVGPEALVLGLDATSSTRTIVADV